MAQPSINMPDGMQTELDGRRHSTTPRSEYIREALLVRFLLEDTDEWDAVYTRATHEVTVHGMEPDDEDKAHQ